MARENRVVIRVTPMFLIKEGKWQEIKCDKVHVRDGSVVPPCTIHVAHRSSWFPWDLAPIPSPLPR
jgi:hypothetical protein